MKMTIQTPDFKATDRLIQFAQRHVDKLERFADRAIECRVLLKLDKSDSGDNKVAEFRLVIPGNDHFASRTAATFEEAITDCVNALKHQLEKRKDASSPRSPQRRQVN